MAILKILNLKFILIFLDFNKNYIRKYLKIKKNYHCKKLIYTDIHYIKKYHLKTLIKINYTN